VSTAAISNTSPRSTVHGSFVELGLPDTDVTAAESVTNLSLNNGGGEDDVASKSAIHVSKADAGYVSGPEAA